MRSSCGGWMYCETCHERLKTGARKCPSCGHAVKGDRDLGSASVRDTAIPTSYSLPPAPTLVDEKPAVAETRREPAVAEARREPAKAPSNAAAARPSAPRAPAPKPSQPEPRRVAASLELGPERVRELLIERPELIEPGLSIYAGRDGGPSGANFDTGVGRIDLLARDRAAGWVVAMVAQASQGKEIVGELLQLIGWVRKHLSAEGQEVRGVVLFDAIPENLGYAAAALSDTVEFKRYRVGVSLEKIAI
ncbi:MAG TPA: hypothetical protein VEC18_08735 [Myxococcota bacterium]|nr:hypothetical protein [Myxococcota bacterium]